MTGEPAKSGVSSLTRSAADSAPDLFGEIAGEVEAAAGAGAFAPPPRRGAGRPAGSPNRTTLKVAEILRRLGYRDPIEQLAAVASMDPVTLGDALCEGLHAKPEARVAARLKAAELIRKAAVDLMPYWHQRLPQAVDVTVRGEQRTLVVIADASEQYQTLSDVVARVSDGEASDDAD